MTTSLKYVHTVSASPSLVYRAFINSTAMREWLCDTVTVDPHPGGRIFLAWNSGYYACGEYAKLQTDKEIQFIWDGRDDPGPTKVRILISALDNGMTTFTLEHLDLQDDNEWSNAVRAIEKGWGSGLRNLVSVLETGSDLRVLRRPMLGILFGDFDEDKAAEIGVPVSIGLRVDNVVEGMGALTAGLRKNDVIISMDGRQVNDITSLLHILERHQAGDKVDLGYYREADKKKIKVELSARPIPEIPMDAPSLAQAVQKVYSESWARISQTLEGVNETEASFRSAPEAWCVSEVLAHLIHGEREVQSLIQDLAFSQERVSDGATGNFNPRILATVKAFGSLERLSDEFKRSQMETVALISGLPEEFVARKGSFWRMGFELLQSGRHMLEHEAQITVAIAAARR